MKCGRCAELLAHAVFPVGRTAAVFVIVLAASAPAAAREQLHDTWTVTCTDTRGFPDGDTFTCVSDSAAVGAFTVRVAGIDAPERGQAYWRVARARLRELAGPGLQVACYKVDRFGRQLCRLSRDGADIADRLLGEGLVWHSTGYASEQTPAELERYARLEGDARQRRTGLWVDAEPMPPWECRRAKERNERCR